MMAADPARRGPSCCCSSNWPTRPTKAPACAILRGNEQRLQRRIVDRAGKTGEHYIAENNEDYRHIWAAAAGGGC